MADQNEILYRESLSSRRTQGLFIALSILFGALFIWHYIIAGFYFLSTLFLVISLFFLFYVLNYRVLHITITQHTFSLNFGLFRWRTRIENIESFTIDELPIFLMYGGAGVHFLIVKHRYRVSFNFLEYPRVVLRLKQARGWVKYVSFSSTQPQKVFTKLAMLTANNN